jgi:uncharacterized membrane protein
MPWRVCKNLLNYRRNPLSRERAYEMSAEAQRADCSQSADYSLIATRNRSLSAAGRLRVFCFVCVVSLAIALAFALYGAWPVLPFAGLEMLVLYLAFRYLDRHEADFERLTIRGDRVLLEIRQGSRMRNFEFNRLWARVILERNGFGDACRLALRSHGREVEFGRDLTSDERALAAREIAHQLRS